ncbi:hypothetical protein [Oceanibaculum pacificum]|nr:hypothetical protein [Oceanibaculum pacificum]
MAKLSAQRLTVLHESVADTLSVFLQDSAANLPGLAAANSCSMNNAT